MEVKSKIDYRKNIKILFFSDTHLGIIDRAYDSFYKTADCGIPIIVIPGNHDGGQLPETLFSSHPLLNIVNKDKKFSFSFNDKQINIYALTYQRNIRDRFLDDIAKFDLNKAKSDDLNLLLMHQSIEGAKVGQHNFTFKKAKDVVLFEDIPKAIDFTLSGHIHRYQILENNGKKAIFCGSTEKTSFAEFSEDKGFVLLEFKKQDNYQKCHLSFEKIASRKMNILKIPGEYNSSFELDDYLKSRIENMQLEGMLQIECANESTIDLLKRDLIKSIFGPNLLVNVKGASKKYFIKNYKLKL
jgi:DNA repair protein SbcD/Mre11